MTTRLCLSHFDIVTDMNTETVILLLSITMKTNIIIKVFFYQIHDYDMKRIKKLPFVFQG